MWLPARATVFLALALLTSSALGEETGEEAGGGEAEVSVGSHRLQPAFGSPRQIEAESLDRLAATTVMLLEGVSGLSLSESLSLGGTPGLRGVSGRRVVVLVDGLRLDTSITPLGGDDLLGLVTPMSLQRLELLRGPGAVAHGSGALGGALALMRRRSTPDPQLGWDAAADLRAGFDSGRLGVFGQLNASGQLRGLGLRATGALRQLGDLQQGGGGGRAQFTSGSEASAEVEAAWAPRRGRLWRASYELLRQPDLTRSDRSRWNNFHLVSRYRDAVRVDYSADEIGRLSTLQATVRYRHERQRRDLFSLSDEVIDHGHERVASLDAHVAAVSDVSIHHVSFGLDVAHDWVASSRVRQSLSTAFSVNDPGTLHPDGSRALELQAFALDQVALGSRLAFEVGARAGLVDLAVAPRGDLGRERTLGTYASSLHARYLLGDGLNLVAGLGQGFLTPNLDDLAAFGCAERGFRMPGPELDMEKSLSSELGVKLDLYGVLTASLFYAYTQLYDAIVERRHDTVPSDCGGQLRVAVLDLENLPGRVHSVDAVLELEFSRWKLLSWVSWAYGSVDHAREGTLPLDRVPPLSGYSAVRYQFGWAGTLLELALRWVAPQDQLGPIDRLDPRLCPDARGCAGTDAYFYLSLRGGMELWRPLRLSVALENFTHERFRSFASGVSAPGFSALLGLEVAAR